MQIDLNDKNVTDGIVNEYADMIFRIAYQNVRRRHCAEDIMQETFLALLKKKSFKDAAHLKAWLIRVTLNKCRDFFRAERRREIPLDAAENFLLAPEREETLEEIFMLPPGDASIIYLHYYEGYTAAEIGKIVKKSENAVYIRLARAREKLKKLLEEEDGGNE